MNRLFIILVLAASASAQNAHVSGKVLSQSGDPSRRATVKLIGKEAYTQMTGNDGTFTFDDVKPGSYALAAARTNFAAQKYGAPAPLIRDCSAAEQLSVANLNPLQTRNLQQCIVSAAGTSITLSANQELKDVVIKLAPFGSISGRLTNADGEPAAGWQVSAERVVYENGVRRLQGGFGARVDADGSYLIADMAPGRYYLHAANLTANMFAGMSADRQGKPKPDADVATYFPSELDSSRARPVDVAPGAEMRSMDIQLRRERVVSVRGTVTVPPNGGSPGDQLLTLGVKGVASTILTQRTAKVRDDGTFEFREVQPGSYVVLSGQVRNGNPGAAETLFANQDVTVADADLEGINLQMNPGIDVAGMMTMEGPAMQAWPTIMLRSDRGVAAGGNPDSDGTIKFRNKMAPGRFDVTFSTIPAGTYIKSVQVGRQDGLHAPIDLSAADRNIAVVLSSKVAGISGSAKPGGVVVAWPRVPMVYGGVKATSTDQDGHFELGDLGPGSYFVAAFDEIEPSLAQTPAFLARFQSEAGSVTLNEGSQGSVDVKPIPRDRVAAEVQKLP